MPSRRSSGRWPLSLLLIAALASACATPGTGSRYQVQVPTLRVRPLVVPCETNQTGRTECAVVLLEDYMILVREVKAACLANGQAAKECQTEPAK